MENTVIQKINVPGKDIFQRAERYYMVLSGVNGLGLTERQVQLLAFTAIKGNISYKSFREEFCEKYKTTPPTINNLIMKLKRMRMLIKDNGKVKVNPKIVLNFEKKIILEIKLDV